MQKSKTLKATGMGNQLVGKVAVVSGAGRGIGRSIALAFAMAGAELAICARSSKSLEVVRAEIAGMGRRCLALPINVADPMEVEEFCSRTTDEFKKIDILVNNAGIYLDRGAFEDSDPVDWWRTVEVNVRGPYLLTRHFLASMASGAKVINISSGKGFAAGKNSSSYHVSKAALNMLTEALANELWTKQIHVNTLVPGPVATTTLSRQDPESGVTTEEILTKYTKEPPAELPPWERVKHPDEVADLALYIACSPTGGATGQVFSLARRPL